MSNISSNVRELSGIYIQLRLLSYRDDKAMNEF